MYWVSLWTHGPHPHLCRLSHLRRLDLPSFPLDSWLGWELVELMHTAPGLTMRLFSSNSRCFGHKHNLTFSFNLAEKVGCGQKVFSLADNIGGIKHHQTVINLPVCCLLGTYYEEKQAYLDLFIVSHIMVFIKCFSISCSPCDIVFCI